MGLSLLEGCRGDCQDNYVEGQTIIDSHFPEENLYAKLNLLKKVFIVLSKYEYQFFTKNLSGEALVFPHTMTDERLACRNWF